MGVQSQAAISSTAIRINEESVHSEKIRYCNSITAHYSDGKIQWDFDIDDVRSQQKGLFMPEDNLPTVRFEFVGKSDDEEPAPPKTIDIAITSCWKMISTGNSKSNWIRKLLDSFRSTGDTQTISYSNILQKVVVNAGLPVSKLSKPAIYQAKVEFKPRLGTASALACDHPGPPSPSHKVTIKRHAPKSVCVTPSVVCT